MKIAVHQTAYVNGYVGTFEIADDATPEQIRDAVQDFAFKHADSGLCHQCTDSLGDVSDTSLLATNEQHEIIYDDSYVSDLQRWRDEVLGALGLPLSAAGHLPAILKAIRETEVRSPAHWHLKTARLYVGAYRRKAWKNFKAGDRFAPKGSRLPGPLVTDPIKRNEEVVVYQDADTCEEYARPASMFDDGRFLPL